MVIAPVIVTAMMLYLAFSFPHLRPLVTNSKAEPRNVVCTELSLWRTLPASVKGSEYVTAVYAFEKLFPLTSLLVTKA